MEILVAPTITDYVPGPEYLEYLVPSNDEVPIEDQPLPADALPTTLSPGYIADSDPKKDLKEDLEDDLKVDSTDYPADGGDKVEEEESSGDDADDEDGEEISEEEDDDEEEEGHLAPTDSSVVPIDDHVPFAEETEPIKTDESAPILPSPRLRRPRISVRPQTPMAAATEALIVAVATALPSSSPPPSPLTLLLFLIPQIPSPPLPLPSPPLPTPLSPLLLPATDYREDVPKADVLPQKRLCLNASTPRFEVGESLAVAARQPGLDDTHVNGYSFVNTVDATPRCRLAMGLRMFRMTWLGIWRREH
ncbi:hypothetical protein Tco_0043420 [Tanacetum coccineum]